MSTCELACAYASLILHDDGILITPEKIATLVSAANVQVESFWPSLFSKLAEKRNIGDLILKAGSAGTPVVVAAPVAGNTGAASAPAAEEKKEEPKEESDDDMGFSLFD